VLIVGVVRQRMGCGTTGTGRRAEQGLDRSRDFGMMKRSSYAREQGQHRCLSLTRLGSNVSYPTVLIRTGHNRDIR